MMKIVTMKLHNLRTTHHKKITNLNITLAKLDIADNMGLFTDDEAKQLVNFLESQPLCDEANVSDINSYDSIVINEETGKVEEYSPYTIPFGTGGFKANLRDWCKQYPLDFDVEILFYEYDDDYKEISEQFEVTNE